MRSAPFATFIALAVLWASATGSRAQLPSPRVAWIFPAGAGVGTTNEVTIAGSDLEDPLELRFSDPRITAAPRPASSNLFSVQVPGDVPAGAFDVRFIGRFGAAPPLTFLISSRPALVIPPANTAVALAVRIDRKHRIHTRISAGSFHWFRFEAHHGERLLVRTWAGEIDSRLVPDLVIFDAAGLELARTRRLGWIDFSASADGEFLLQLADDLFRGGDDYICQIEITEDPFIDFALPTVLQDGITNRVTLYGRNLPGSRRSRIRGADGLGLDALEIGLPVPSPRSPRKWPSNHLSRPASATLDVWDWIWSATNGTANRLLFTVVTNPVVCAVPADTPDARGRLFTNLTRVTPPVEFSSLFPRAGELSGVEFTAAKSEVFFLELVAERMGLPVDPHAVVQRETPGKDGPEFKDVVEITDFGGNQGGNEFNTTSRDGAARFQAPEAGTYRVVVRDLFHASPTAPRRPYRLSVRRPAPDFSLVAWSAPQPKAKNDDRSVHPGALNLRRGQTLGFHVAAFRQDGFNGEIEITASHLPTGVTAAATRIPAGQNSGWLMLSATGDAPPSVSKVEILGKAADASGLGPHPARWGAVKWPVADYNNEFAVPRLAQETVLGVVAESAPLTLSPAVTQRIIVAKGARLKVPFGITRRFEFPGAFNLKPIGHAALEKAPELKVGEKATNAVWELNLAETALPEGTHTLWLQGQVAGKYRDQPEAADLADAALKAADKALSEAPADRKSVAELKRKDAEAVKKAAQERAKPRDVTLSVWSQPFIVEVVPAAAPADKK